MRTRSRYSIAFEELEPERETRLFEAFTGFRMNASYAGFKLRLQRKPLSYIFNHYLPSGLFVAVSWASFVIPVEAIPGRIALIITTFLVLTNIANSAFSSSPAVQGVNALQVIQSVPL